MGKRKFTGCNRKEQTNEPLNFENIRSKKWMGYHSYYSSLRLSVTVDQCCSLSHLHCSALAKEKVQTNIQ